MVKKYFGTDGIRGAVNSKNINGDMFFKFGLATGTYFKTQKNHKYLIIHFYIWGFFAFVLVYLVNVELQMEFYFFSIHRLF